MLSQIRKLVFHKYANLFLTSILPPNRACLFFNSFDITNASSEVRPINGIIDYWYSTYQFLSNFILKILFLLPILFHLSISSYYLGFGFVTWETNLINHEIPRISPITIFRKREVSLDRYLVDCYVSILVVSLNGE